MRILYYDIDTLRPDHLGCYGYIRDTSPNIDKVANEGNKFNNCFVSDAPCLPSRASMFLGRFGIHNGIVDHGGIAADPKLEGKSRDFNIVFSPERGFVTCLKNLGFYTVTVSPFAERHAAWWFYQGFREIINPGKFGNETADEVVPLAINWLDKMGSSDNWFLHVNVWDPHGWYRTPEKYGNPFENSEVPDWPTDEIINMHYNSYGPHSAREPIDDRRTVPPTKRMVAAIRNRKDYKVWIDGYDVGIKYADEYFGKIVEKLKELKIYDDTMIIITSDHGENQGELNVYGDHQTADYITTRVPMIIKLPWQNKGKEYNAFHYQNDIAATILDLLGGEIPESWDAKSFAESLTKCEDKGRQYLVVSQNAWSCQRAVLFDDYILIKTYHDGYKNFDKIMLFNIKTDPHETKNLADDMPDIVNKGLALLNEWYDEMMKTSKDGIDPMQIVLREGGPFHVRGQLSTWIEYLKNTGRAEFARKLEKEHPDEL